MSALPIDLAVPALDVDYRLYRELAGLAPCGPGNPDPLVAVLGLTVTRVRPATGGHSQLTLRRDRDVLDGIAFGRADLAEIVREGDRLDVVARLTSRTFGGFESLQLEIRDVATAGSHPAAAGDPRRRDDRSRARRERVMTRPASSPTMRSAPPALGRSAGPRAVDRRARGRRVRHVGLLNGQVPFAGSPSGNGNGERRRQPGVDRGRRRRRTSSSCRRGVTFKGSIVYAKAGNIWVQTGKDARQLTDGGSDSMPSWSPDGDDGLLRPDRGRRSVAGRRSGASATTSARRPDRHARRRRRQRSPSSFMSGKVEQGQSRLVTWSAQPCLSPDGTTLALVSDRPDPTSSDVVLQFTTSKTKKIRDPKLRESAAARPSGSGLAARRQAILLYVATAATGRAGRRRSGATTVATSKGAARDRPGLSRALLVARRAVHRRDQDEQLGTDIVILDAATGASSCG